MKITKRQLKGLIKEVIEESKLVQEESSYTVSGIENVPFDERGPGYKPESPLYDFYVDVDGIEYNGSYNIDTEKLEWDWNGEDDEVPPNYEEVEEVVIDAIFKKING